MSEIPKTETQEQNAEASAEVFPAFNEITLDPESVEARETANRIAKIVGFSKERKVELRHLLEGDYRVKYTIEGENPAGVEMFLRKSKDYVGKNPREIFLVPDMNLSFGDKKYDLADFGIDNENLKLKIVDALGERGGLMSGIFDDEGRPTKGFVEIGSLSTPEDIAVVLHEVGHFEDFKENPGTDQDACVYSKVHNEGVEGWKHEDNELAGVVSARERKASAFALNKIRQIGMPIAKSAKSFLESALGTYDEFGNVTGENNPNYYASSEARANV